MSSYEEKSTSNKYANKYNKHNKYNIHDKRIEEELRRRNEENTNNEETKENIITENEENNKKKLYIYSVRRARRNKKTEYIGLIPKLFTDGTTKTNKPDFNFREKYQQCIKFIKDKNLRQFSEKSYFYIIFNLLLNDERNILKKSRYIDEDDIEKIIKLNLEIFEKENFGGGEDKFMEFFTHLYLAHGDEKFAMEYGLYYSMLKANDDEEFLEEVRKIRPCVCKGDKNDEANERIIYYIELNKLLNHIDKIKQENELVSDLCYWNPFWNYGEHADKGDAVVKEKKNEKSIIYKKEKKEEFINTLKQKSNKLLAQTELICQIPLPIELFEWYMGKGEIRGGRYYKHRRKRKTRRVRTRRKRVHRTRKRYNKIKCRKHKGIYQSGYKKGKLKKNYMYTGKKTKSGKPQIKKIS